MIIIMNQNVIFTMMKNNLILISHIIKGIIGITLIFVAIFTTNKHDAIYYYFIASLLILPPYYDNQIDILKEKIKNLENKTNNSQKGY